MRGNRVNFSQSDLELEPMDYPEDPGDRDGMLKGEKGNPGPRVCLVNPFLLYRLQLLNNTGSTWIL